MCALLSSVLLVEREVQLQNIDSRIAENAEITPIGVLLDEFADFVFAQCPGLSYTRDLELGITQADLRIESATRRGNCIRRHRLGTAQAVFSTIRRDSFFDRIVQFLRSRPQIATPGTCRVVAVARGGRSRVKVFRIRERLA